MATELEDAIKLYQENIEELTVLLRSDPNNVEALQLKEQLDDELKSAEDTLAALKAVETSVDVPQKEKEPDAGPAPVDHKAQGRGGHPNNLRIHPKSKYCYEEPDFKMLAEKYPSFKKFVKITDDGVGVLSFSDPKATLELTRVLMMEDFGLQWDIPLGQLVPPLTGRLNYILWLQDLLDLSSPPGPVCGLDVGCGANCVYPLLGAVAMGWQFLGIDVTDVAIEWAQKNVDANPHIANLISLRKVPEGASGILRPAIQQGEHFHFCMCNPPFFGNMEEAGQNPNTAYGGTDVEMVYPGGESAFVLKMVEDSVKLKDAVHWYSAMFGKKSTLKEVRNKLYGLGLRAVRTTEFCQGKTSRWAIAWSFAAKNTENKALKRQATGAMAPRGVALRNLSHDIKSGGKSSFELLQVLESLFSVRGAACSVDTSKCELKAQAHIRITPMAGTQKKQRTDSTAEHNLTVETKLDVSVRIVQGKAGAWTMMAAISKQGSNAEARGFSRLMNDIWGDLDTMWGS